MSADTINHYGLPVDLEEHRKAIFPKNTDLRDIVVTEAAKLLIQATTPVAEIDEYAQHLNL